MAESFTVFPALDLRLGKVVRLSRGNPEQQTTYGQDPVVWAEKWISEGAQWLHVINLDGAFGEDSGQNMRALESILKTGIDVEFGGGIRSRETIKSVMDLGVRRVFLGSAAILDPALLDWAIAAYGPSRIAGDIGVFAGKVVIKGWQEQTNLNILDVGKRFRARGLEWCVLTDVQRDGTSSGVDITNAVALKEISGLQVVASGGVRCLQDIINARSSGLAGIIVGKALYDQKITLSEWFAISRRPIPMSAKPLALEDS